MYAPHGSRSLTVGMNTRSMLISFVISLLGLNGCTTTKVSHGSAVLEGTVRRSDETVVVGLIADSQLQTEKVKHYVSLWRNSWIDKHFLPLSIRSPALDVSAQEMLKYFLNRFHGANVILYLGDAANNGCLDELSSALNLLGKFRSEKRPVFFVIGNHDYLGAGNTATMFENRKELCGAEESNPPLSKYEALKRISHFNRKSAEVAGWAYLDSLGEDIDEGLRALKDRCGSGNGHEQHLQDGCYLAGTATNGQGMQILLIDTSDYADKNHQAKFAGVEMYGEWGWMSFLDKTTSQTSWFSRQLKSQYVPRIRIIASHYSRNDLRLKIPGLRVHLSKSVGRPGRLFEPYPQESIYWISAHTHAEKPRPSVGWISKNACKIYTFWRCWGQTRPVGQLNIGSTTDWEPHAVIAEVSSELIYETIRIDVDEEWCEEVIRNLRQATAPDYESILNEQKGLGLFGMDKNYWAESWDPERHRKLANKNLRKFVKETSTHDDELETWACIGKTASWIEKRKR